MCGAMRLKWCAMPPGGAGQDLSQRCDCRAGLWPCCARRSEVTSLKREEQLLNWHKKQFREDCSWDKVV